MATCTMSCVLQMLVVRRYCSMYLYCSLLQVRRTYQANLLNINILMIDHDAETESSSRHYCSMYLYCSLLQVRRTYQANLLNINILIDHDAETESSSCYLERRDLDVFSLHFSSTILPLAPSSSPRHAHNAHPPTTFSPFN